MAARRDDEHFFVFQKNVCMQMQLSLSERSHLGIFFVTHRLSLGHPQRIRTVDRQSNNMGQTTSMQEDKMKKRIRQAMGTFMDFGTHLKNANEWYAPTLK